MPASPPAGWRHVRMDEVAEVVSGGTPPRGDADCWGGGIPWLTPSEVTRLAGRTVDFTNESITEAGAKRAGLTVLPPGSVILTTRATIGAVARVGTPLTTNQGFQNLVPRQGVDGGWLYYSAERGGVELQRLAGGSTFKEVSRQSVRGLGLLLPPLPEQRAIAAVLDAADDTIERTAAVIAATEELRRALLHELLTRGVPGWHSEWKHVPGLGTVPARWEVTTLGECLDGIEAGRSPRCEPRPARDGEWGVLKVSSVTAGEFQPTENKALPPGIVPEPSLEVRVGDVLVSRASGNPDLVGRCVYVFATPPRLLLCDKTLRLHGNAERLEPRFLAAVLGTPGARTQIVGSFAGGEGWMGNVSQDALRQLRVALPGLVEQRSIADLLCALDARRVAQQAALGETRVLKATLADVLLTGGLRIRPQGASA